MNRSLRSSNRQSSTISTAPLERLCAGTARLAGVVREIAASCHLAGIVLITLTFAGCRHADPVINSLESELRWLEDQLYLAEDQYRQKAKELESCRIENRAYRNQFSSGDRRADEPFDATTQPEANDRSIQPQQSPGELPSIEIEPGQPFDPTEPPVDTTNDSSSSADSVSPSLRPASRQKADRVRTPVSDPVVTRIVINPRLTGGLDTDRQQGDEGLMIVVEPRNAAGQYVAIAGPLTIIATDPRQPKSQAPIANWRFTAVESARLLRETLFGKGMHLELPWPNEPPAVERLELTVHYTAVDSRKLSAQREIQVELQRTVQDGWTPRASAESHTKSNGFRTRQSPSHREQLSGARGQLPSPNPAKTIESNGRDDNPRMESRTQSEPIERPTWRPYR